MSVLETLKHYKNFWKYDFEHYELWCFRLNKRSCEYNNLLEYKSFLKELESE